MSSVTARGAATVGDVFLATRGTAVTRRRSWTPTFRWCCPGVTTARGCAVPRREWPRSACGMGTPSACCCSNRPEFHVADAAALLLGATPFSMYNTSAPEQLTHVIADAGCRVVITEDALLDRLRAALEHGRTGSVDHVIVVESGFVV